MITKTLSSLSVRVTLATLIALSAQSAMQVVSDAREKNERANALIQNGKPEEAIPLYRELAAAFPKEVSFKINLAVALYKSGRYRETVGECEEVLRAQPNSFPGLLFLGASQMKLGDTAAGESALREALRLRPSDPNARIMLADALAARDRWSEAADEYERCSDMLPDNPRVLLGIMRSFEALSEERLEKIKRDAPGSPEALALAGQFDFERGDPGAAFVRFREALAVRPSFRGLHGLVAEIYSQTNHPDWAAMEKGKAEGEEACRAVSIECEFVSGRYREAASARAESVAEDYWQARASLVLAGKAFDRLEVLPASREKCEALAERQEKRGRYPEAVSAWQETVRLDPSDAVLKRRLALALCHSNDCGSALPLLKEQLARDGRSAELNYLYGLALNVMQKPAEALPYLEKAVHLDETFLPAQGALGEAYLELNRASEAIPHLQAALAADESGSRRYQLAKAFEAAGMRKEAAAARRDYREIQQRRSDTTAAAAITPP